MNIKNLEDQTENWQAKALEIVDDELQMGSKFVIWKYQINKVVKEFKALLAKRMSWIRKRLTPNKEDVRKEFVEIVKSLST